MKRNISRYIALSVGFALLPAQLVYAEAGVNASKELTSSQASQDLLKNDPTDTPTADLSKNGIDNSSGQTYNQGGSIGSPYKAQGGPLTLRNCNSGGISVKTFNSNDSAMWVPFQTVGIAATKMAGLKCATSSCKLQIGGLKTGALSGYQVYVGGKVKPTNQQAMAMSCAIYK